MRKLALLALGLMLFSGAAGAFAYRVLAAAPPSSVARAAASEPAARAAMSPYERRVPFAQSPPTRPRSAAGWHTFETLLNVANVVVGVLGIWMTVIGMRLQRTAARV
jgi:hypothetical protein